MAATRIENTVLRRVVIALCVIAPLSVSYARLYRGAHHISDILVGILNGVVCALLAWNYLRREPARAPAAGGGCRASRDGSDPRVAGSGEGVHAVRRDPHRDEGQQERPERLVLERLQRAVEALRLLGVARHAATRKKNPTMTSAMPLAM